MKNVKLLDCTLRDGGRIVDCKFSDFEIKGLIDRLSLAKIDIIEVGFLRDWRVVNYVGGSTFFTSVKQIERFLTNKDPKTTYVAFIDYGMFDFDSLDPCDGKSVDGLRVGFTKNNYLHNWDDVKRCMNIVKEKGYKLFVQGVNSLGYKSDELLEVIDEVNEIKPVSFGIVDTYGAMYLDDIERIFNIVDNKLNKDIAIDVHLHNNKQMAFALAQEAIRLSEKANRNIFIDATLEGMGKGAGNLNMELIIAYLSQEKLYDYDFDGILDLIDDFTFSFKKTKRWGYSVPSFLAGIYKSHPNNIIYLTEKFRLSNKDIKNILSMIDEQSRQTYKYDIIEQKYIEYNNTNVDDKNAIEKLREMLTAKDILVLAPGSSLNKYTKKIESFIDEKKPIVISVNFVSTYPDSLAFFGNKKRYDSLPNKDGNIIAVSNVKPSSSSLEISYDRLIDRRYVMFDNSTIMLLNLLKLLSVKSITIAGFDGYSKKVKSNFFDSNFFNHRDASEYELLNKEISKILSDFIKTTKERCPVKFITPSLYERNI